MSGPKILAIPGSLRTGSLNRMLLKVAVGELTKLGAEVDQADLKELALPIYDGDIEGATGQPAGGKLLREKISRADALLIVTPEYNHGIPGGLKNAIDWASRPPDQPLKGKVAALMGASPGAFGAVRSLTSVRQTLTALGVWLVPSQVTLSFANKAFTETGELKEARTLDEVKGVVTALVDEAKRRSAARS